jgi:hypothetical protein
MPAIAEKSFTPMTFSQSNGTRGVAGRRGKAAAVVRDSRRVAFRPGAGIRRAVREAPGGGAVNDRGVDHAPWACSTARRLPLRRL